MHIDIHVDDLEAALARAMGTGAVLEQRVEDPEHGSLATCGDVSGHGLCLIGRGS